MIKYLIVGTGRCGTAYMARLLTSLGFMCGHEAIFEHDGLPAALDRLQGKGDVNTSYCSRFDLLREVAIDDWFDPKQMVAESSFLAVPFLHHPALEQVQIIHLVRHPLKVVSSFVKDIHFFSGDKDMKHWTKVVYENCPSILKENTEIEKACRYYIEWNKMIEQRSDLFLRVEDQPSIELFDFLSVVSLDVCEDKEINSWKRRSEDFKTEDIPKGNTRDQFLETMLRYGY